MDTNIKRFLCAVLLTFPELRLCPRFQQQQGLRPDSARTGLLWWSLQHTTHSLTTGEAWAATYKPTGDSFCTKNSVNFILKFLQFYCTLYIITIFLILNSRLFVCSLLIRLLYYYTQITKLFCILLVISINFVLINSTLLNSIHFSLYLLISVHYIIKFYSGGAVISDIGSSSTCKYCFTLYK